MNKRLLLLFGIAIIAVVLNHSLLWRLAANPNLGMDTSTASRYTIISSTDFSLSYFILVILKKLTNFAVPSFLFASGFFAAYAGRKVTSGSQTKIVLNRALALIIPYLIWSVVVYLTNPFQLEMTPLKLAARVLYGGLIPEYYFVPMLIQFTILAPLFIGLARDRSRLFLIGAAIIQLSVTALSYISLVTPIPYVQYFFEIRRIWSLFPTWAFFFPLGMVFSFQTAAFQKYLSRNRQWLLAGALVFFVLSVVESQTLLVVLGVDWWDNILSIPSTLFSLCAIAVLLAYDFTGTRFAKPLIYLSNKTFAIYLVHPIVIDLLKQLIVLKTPNLLAYPLLLLFVMAAVGLGVPLLLITLGRNYFGARVNKYIFG